MTKRSATKIALAMDLGETRSLRGPSADTAKTLTRVGPGRWVLRYGEPPHEEEKINKGRAADMIVQDHYYRHFR